ncbi:flagellar filament capping protein FliD [Paenibacillus sp. AD87]|uniref:flagellar filament capping protein FliD n=1 Tax=Paenibacillus sp. AD87 TaxID=1528787 RepID=UPI0007E36355|nr:flagellar filament capping protein FliD [Paenibacillus sp. AD87]OAX46336.1 Flagellar hook-associated protein 2 [Paenibacillus sp. AD87]
MVMRLTGLASGLDIDTMVQKLMQAEKVPLNKMNQQRQLLDWKRESYREVSTKMVTFLQDKIKDTFSKASSLNAQKATVTGNTTAVTATASATASGSMTVGVTKLATAANVILTGQNGKSETTKLTDLGLTSGTSLQVGGSTISIDESDTIATLVSKINNNSATGVTAIYDATSGLSLTATASGTDGKLFTNNSAPDNNSLNIDSKLKDIFWADPTDGTVKKAQNAEVTVNGLSMEKTSNMFTINGVTLTLNTITAAGSEANVTVSKDTDAIVKSVKDFVDSYNQVLSLMNSKVSEERYTKYAPLTSEQKADMKEDEITEWTNKAKSGMLKNDSILQEAISSMRSAIMGDVDTGNGKVNLLQGLGISTGDYQSKGKLTLDVDKLKEALERNPNAVNEVFTTNYDKVYTSDKVTDKDGILARLQKITTNALKSMNTTAGVSISSSDITASFMTSSTIGTQLSSLDRRISEFTSKLNNIETNYFKKFTAMETAINKYNSSASSLFG